MHCDPCGKKTPKPAREYPAVNEPNYNGTNSSKQISFAVSLFCHTELGRCVCQCMSPYAQYLHLLQVQRVMKTLRRVYNSYYEGVEGMPAERSIFYIPPDFANQSYIMLAWLPEV